jgi:hypothetical protein
MLDSRIESSWDEADLIARLCRALEIAHHSVTLLAADGYTSSNADTPSLRGEKVVAETGVLLLAAGPMARRSDEVRDRAHELVRVLAPHARGERVRARICLEPSLALDHAAAHLCLSRLGFPDPNLDRLLRESLQAESAFSRERHPHRQLEQEWLVRVWNVLPTPAKEDPYLPKRSALGRSMDLLSASKDDVYAFTHAIMYITDLGTRRARLPRSSRTIAADADSALASCLAEPDYDIAGEVLLTWPMLRRRWSSSATVGFAVLASVEDRAGFLSGSGISLGRPQAAEGEQQSRYTVATAYHTAYVMGLLCAAALGPGRTPSVCPAPAPRRLHGAAGELMALVADEPPQADWCKYVTELPPAAQDSAAELILHICLRHAAVRRDLGTLAAALHVAERYGMLDTPACHQAAQLLRRTATFAALPQREPVVVPEGRESTAQGTAICSKNLLETDHGA